MQPRVLVADVAGQLEHQADGDAGGRAAERAGAADHDAARLRRLGVDRGVAHAGGDQELEIGQRLDHLARKAGALAHGDDDLEVLERRDDLIGPAEMLVEDLDIDVALDLGPVGDLEHDVLIVVENCAANRHDASTPCKQRPEAAFIRACVGAAKDWRGGIAALARRDVLGAFRVQPGRPVRRRRLGQRGRRTWRAISGRARAYSAGRAGRSRRLA